MGTLCLRRRDAYAHVGESGERVDLGEGRRRSVVDVDSILYYSSASIYKRWEGDSA